MWFDEIMEDCKNALRITNNNKGIFVPIFIKLGLSILLFATTFAFVIGYIVRIANFSFRDISDLQILFRELPIVLAIGIIIYFLYLLGSSIIEVGAINLLKMAVAGNKLKSSHFFEGIKNYFLKVLGGKLIILLIVLVLSPVIIGLYLLYTVLIGTLTAGWGITFLSAFITVYFTSWTTAVVVDNLSPIKAIGISIKLGKKYFWGLFTIILSSILISRYIAVVFGPLVALLGGWFIAGVILTYFKLVVLMVYNRKREGLF
jgi:hypothetical protein